MIDRTMLYNIIYALAACNGRQDVLFGSCAPLALEAFTRSLAGTDFPELWFELPLLGDPWFDLHVNTGQASVVEGGPLVGLDAQRQAELFAWFARQPYGARQVSFGYDVSSGTIDDHAVQFLTSGGDAQITSDFLRVAGRPDLTSAYEGFVARIPESWFACYTGIFPQRPGMGVRVECIPSAELQRRYATDAELLEQHLRQAGFEAFDTTLLPRCQQLAGTPFQLEFQFDVAPDGSTGSTIGVSLRFGCPPGEERMMPFGLTGAPAELMGQLEAWGLADARWRRLAEVMFAKQVGFGGEHVTMYCYPAFIKLRWREGMPLDAKTYLVAGVNQH